jgi:hypothetical protein
MSFVNSISTSAFNIIGKSRLGMRKRESANLEVAPWKAVLLLRNYNGVDIDEYRAKHGKDEGEAKFFHDNTEDERKIFKHNLFMFNGASALFQYALGLGTSSNNSSLSSGPTYLINGQSYLYVSDGGPTLLNSGSTTVSATNGVATVTASSSTLTPLVVGNNLVITGDSSSGVYSVTAISGTTITISPAFGGANISGATAGAITAPSHSQTALQGGTNFASQSADSTFPSNPTAALFNTISGATNVSPIVLSVTGSDIAQNDICQVVEVLGNTAANGVWVAGSGTTSTSLSLQGSTGNGVWISGGLATKRSVLTMQSTFGATAAVFQWNEWGLFNGNNTNKIMFNRRSIGMGTKSSGTSSALKVGIGIG